MAAAVRVGVIGTGVMGAQHARLLAHEVPGAELVAVHDADPQRADGLARELGVLAADSPAALADRVEAVVVAAADATHAGLVIPLLDSGLSVLCEKPLATDPAEARRIVDAERSTGRRLLTTGFMRRHDPGYGELRAALRSGAYGRALMVHCVHRNAGSGGPTTARSSVVSSASHEFDVLRWLTGREIVEVTAHVGRSGGGPDTHQDPLLLVLRTDDDVLVTVEIFVNAVYGYEVRCEVVAERGTVTLDALAPTVHRRDAAVGRSLPTVWTPRFADAYRRELIAWVRSVTAGVPDPDAASGWDGLVAATVAQAAVTAVEGARPVTVPVEAIPAFYRRVDVST